MNETTAKSYPLDWPAGWKRTAAASRKSAAFGKRGSPQGAGGFRPFQKLELGDGLKRLEAELRRLNAASVVISTNLATNADGRPYVKQPKMLEDPGIAVYFKLKGKPLALACDTWRSAAENMAALAGHIEAIRAQDRYGVGSIEQAFAGYKALPADTAANWRAVFGFAADAMPTSDEVNEAYRTSARTHHPDAGGAELSMAHVNRAREFALAELKERGL